MAIEYDSKLVVSMMLIDRLNTRPARAREHTTYYDNHLRIADWIGVTKGKEVLPVDNNITEFSLVISSLASHCKVTQGYVDYHNTIARYLLITKGIT